MTKLLPFFTSSGSFPLPDSDIKNDISGNCPLSFNPYWQRQPRHPTATTATIMLLKHAARALAGGPLGGHFYVASTSLYHQHLGFMTARPSRVRRLLLDCHVVVLLLCQALIWCQHIVCNEASCGIARC